MPHTSVVPSAEPAKGREGPEEQIQQKMSFIPKLSIGSARVVPWQGEPAINSSNSDLSKVFSTFQSAPVATSEPGGMESPRGVPPKSSTAHVKEMKGEDSDPGPCNLDTVADVVQPVTSRKTTFSHQAGRAFEGNDSLEPVEQIQSHKGQEKYANSFPGTESDTAANCPASDASPPFLRTVRSPYLYCQNPNVSQLKVIATTECNR